MGTLLQLGTTFQEVELKKRATRISSNTAGTVLPLVVEERISVRKVVLADLPARVLVDGDWQSIDLIDMSEKGFSFEVDRIMGALFRPGLRLVFALRIPELREFTLFGRIQWTKFDDVTKQKRCGVEIIEVHGPGGGININDLLKLLLATHGIPSSEALPVPQTKTAA